MSEPFNDPMPHVDGVTHRYVDAGGLRVHVAEAGPEDGEPILLLHGWPQNWYLWRGVVPALSQRYRLLMPDLRGVGWTQVTERGYEKENLARDQVALLDALGIETVKLMGHDWGGFAGFLMSLLHPERVERFVPCNIIHPWPRTSARSVMTSWRAIYQVPMVLPFLGPRLTRKAGVVKWALRKSVPDGTLSDYDLEAYEAPYRHRAQAKATAQYYRSFQLHDFPLLMRRHWSRYRLTIPTLMIYGTGDFAVRPSTLEGYERYADDMRIEQIPDTGHFVVDVAPDRVAQLALDFFSSR